RDGVAATLARRGVEPDESAAIADERVRVQQHVLHPREDGRVRSDADAYREDDDEREAARLPERPCAVADVLPDRSHSVFSGSGAWARAVPHGRRRNPFREAPGW